MATMTVLMDMTAAPGAGVSRAQVMRLMLVPSGNTAVDPALQGLDIGEKIALLVSLIAATLVDRRAGKAGCHGRLALPKPAERNARLT